MYNILTQHKVEEFDIQSFWKLESLGVNSKELEGEDTEYIKKTTRNLVLTLKKVNT